MGKDRYTGMLSHYSGPRFRLAAVVLATVFFDLAASAQKPAPKSASKPATKGASNMERLANPPAKRPPPPPALPGPMIERLRSMTPEQREKALSRLPPERRAMVEQRLNRIEQLPPEQRTQLEGRYQRFQSLPPARRLAVREELQNLRGLPPAERRRRFLDPGFQQEYSTEEQQILRESLGPGAR